MKFFLIYMYMYGTCTHTYEMIIVDCACKSNIIALKSSYYY